MKSAALVLVSASALAAPAFSQSQPCEGGEIHDDGTSEITVYTTYAGPDGTYRYVSRFTPPSYPYVYHTVCLEVASVASDRAVEIVAYNDNGPGGIPGTELESVNAFAPASATRQWITAEIGCLRVNSGSVWIGLRAVGSPPVNPRADTSTSHPYYTSTTFQPWENRVPACLMIRAQGQSGDGLGLANRRVGTAGNPLCYTAGRPVIGRNWSAQVAHSSSALFTAILFHERPASGPVLPAGQLLVDLASPRIAISTRASGGLFDAHDLLLPDDPALVGLSVASQAIVREPGALRFCNAYDLVVGCR